MADEEKRIIVDDDWKAEAHREKEQLAEQAAQAEQAAAAAEALPTTPFIELINLLVMQAMAGLGMMAGPGGERIPPSMEMAKHFIDMLQMLEDKTKGNLIEDEKKILDQVLYEMRMQYVQVSSRGGARPMATPPPTA